MGSRGTRSLGTRKSPRRWHWLERACRAPSSDHNFLKTQVVLKVLAGAGRGGCQEGLRPGSPHPGPAPCPPGLAPPAEGTSNTASPAIHGVHPLDGTEVLTAGVGQAWHWVPSSPFLPALPPSGWGFCLLWGPDDTHRRLTCPRLWSGSRGCFSLPTAWGGRVAGRFTQGDRQCSEQCTLLHTQG